MNFASSIKNLCSKDRSGSTHWHTSFLEYLCRGCTLATRHVWSIIQRYRIFLVPAIASMAYTSIAQHFVWCIKTNILQLSPGSFTSNFCSRFRFNISIIQVTTAIQMGRRWAFWKVNYHFLFHPPYWVMAGYNMRGWCIAWAIVVMNFVRAIPNSIFSVRAFWTFWG